MPFLSQSHTFELGVNETRGINASLFGSETIEGVINSSIPLTNRSTFDPYKDFKLFVPFSITGCVALLTAFLFMSYYFTDKSRETQEKGTNVPLEKRELPLKIRVIILTLFTFMFLAFAAVVDTFKSLLATFCVEHLQWSKSNGSILTSLLGFGTLTGRFLCFFMVQKVQNKTLLNIHACMTLLAFLGFAISAQYKFDTGIWISVPLIGYAHAPGYACMMCWMDDFFIPISGNLTTYLFMTR